MNTSLLLALALVPAGVGAQSFDEHFAKGRQFMDSSKYDDAVKSFERAIKVNDKHSDAHLWLARALGSVAQNANVLRQPFLAKRAKSEFDKAAELDPTSWGAREGLMQFYLRAPGVMGGSMAKAKEEAATIAKLNPYRGFLAANQIAVNEKDQAAIEKNWRAFYAAFPDSSGAMSNIVVYLTNNNRVEETWPIVEKFLAAHPDHIIGKWRFAVTAALTGKQLDKGEQFLRELLTIPADSKGPRVPYDNLHLRLGDIHLKRGDKAKAKAEYQESLKINPKNELAKRSLEGVK